MLMGFVAVLGSGPNGNHARDWFPVSFLLHFLDKQKVEKNLSVDSNILPWLVLFTDHLKAVGQKTYRWEHR